MFTLNETEIASTQAAYASGGELAAAVGLRRLFPGISDMAHARRCAVTIAGWTAPVRDRR